MQRFLHRRVFVPWMLVCVVVGALVGSGCARRYNVTLTNGNVISTTSKPKFDPATGAYKFKDLNGQPTSVAAFRVKEIAPSSGWTDDESPGFTAPSAR